MNSSTAGWARRLYVFVKPPKMGRAKTRLAAEIGAGAAATFYRNSVSGLFRRLGDDPRWGTVVAVDGEGARKAGWASQWPEHLPRVDQGAGDLGDRLRRLVSASPPGPLVVIGSDAPQIAPGHIARAFAELDGNDLVAGPAEDGGYWLIGARRMRGAEGLFRDVRWSTEHALADTLASAPAHWRIGLLDRLSDVDDAESLARVAPLGARAAPARAVHARATAL